jgi:D-threonine aldolase
LQRRVSFLNVTGLKPVSQSEEHLVLEADEAHGLKVGEVLYGLPFHICPTVALYERLHTIEDGRLTGEWKVVARDRKIGI